MSIRIHKLHAPSFQGRDISLSLEAANLITGAPFSGKTSISRAARISMYGYLSTLGKEHASTFQLSSSPKELFVRSVFTDGRANQIVINRDEEGSLTKQEDLQVEFPIVLMDANVYLSMTGQKRLSYVLERIDLRKAGYDEKALLKDMSSVPTPDCDDVTFKLYTDAVAKWAGEIKASTLQRDRTKSSITLWMDSLLERFKKAEKQCKDMVKASKVAVDLFNKQSEPKDLGAEREQAHKALLTAAEKVGKGDDGEKSQLQDQLSAARENIVDLRGDIGELELEEVKMKKLTHCPVCLSAGKEWLDRWQAEHEKRKKPLVTAIRESEAEIKELEKKIQSFDKKREADKRTAKIKAERDEAQAAYDEVNDKQNQRLAWEHSRANAQLAKQNSAQASVEQQVLKHMSATLVKHQAKLVEEAFNGVLKTARAFTDGILNSPLEYRDGELGRRFSKLDEQQGKSAPIGSWISHEAFSGTEQLLAYAGLQVALCKDAPCKVVISDELGRMPSDFCERVATRMLELLRDGKIDQWIGISCDKSWLSGKLRSQVNVIEMK